MKKEPTYYETRFCNFFYLFTILDVRSKDMCVMLYRYAYEKKYREIAKLEEKSWQACSIQVNTALKKIRKNKSVIENIK